jgi:type VI secretion system secreted protein VgrG
VTVKSKESLDFSRDREVTSTAAYKVSARKVEISGDTEITLKVGASSIKIDPSGVTILGPIVKLN